MTFRALTGSLVCVLALGACSEQSDRADWTVALGSDHCLYKSPAGNVYSSGANHVGQLGLDHRNPVGSQVSRIPGISDAIQVAVGSAHSLVLDRRGRVFSFGDSLHGQMGVEGTRLSASPTVVKTLPDRIVKVAAGGAHSVAMTKDGAVYVWGSNTQQQLGRTTGLRAQLPIPLRTAGKALAIDVAAGPASTFVLDSGGAAFIFGNGHVAKACCWPDAKTLRPKPEAMMLVDGAGNTVHALPRPEANTLGQAPPPVQLAISEVGLSDLSTLPDGRWLGIDAQGSLHFRQDVCGLHAPGKQVNSRGRGSSSGPRQAQGR